MKNLKYHVVGAVAKEVRIAAGNHNKVTSDMVMKFIDMNLMIDLKWLMVRSDG